MPKAPTLNSKDIRSIDALLNAYGLKKETVSRFLGQVLVALSESSQLTRWVHSFKSRLKDPEHLRDKLERKVLECKSSGTTFDVTADNLLVKVNDLAGVRILHLYGRQFREINAALQEIFAEQGFPLQERPFARTWDDEYRAFFSECGIQTQDSPAMYTSVHYVIGASSKTPVTCEIQVRTLMEEVWGEVDHILNYPTPSLSLPCREQLKVLARLTSSASRLVDSIFLTAESEASLSRAAGQGAPAKGRVRKARRPASRRPAPVRSGPPPTTRKKTKRT